MLPLVLAILSFVNPYDTYTAHPSQIAFYYKNRDTSLKYLEAIKSIEPRTVFAMNAQMFGVERGTYTYTPTGLYIEKGRQVSKLRLVNNPRYNFGMQPQCIFAITKDGKAVLTPVQNINLSSYYYAVQLAPMLVIDGKINPRLTRSHSKYVRNGVGLLRDGRVLFALSRSEVTFQEFAAFFKEQGCVTASYIDGAVSETWHDGLKVPYPGEFAVMVGVRKVDGGN